VAYVVGLTGGIGSGKSAVAEAFEALGVEIVDADVLAHRLSARGEPGHVAIAREFGSDVLLPSGELNRARLRERAFADASDRRRLESILHPLIGDLARHEMARWSGPYGILVVPLLLERKGLGSVVDRVLVVDCPEDEQVRRVVARSGLTDAQVRAIMATQLDRPTRLAATDDILDNSGPREKIAMQVAALNAKYRQLAAEGRPLSH
jgi:dephospho-CoA kinase